MSNLSRKNALNGKTHRRKDGRFLPIGVQRRVLVMVAMFAAFVTMAVGTALSLDVFAGESDYVITYQVNGGNVNSASLGGTWTNYSGLPKSDGRTVTDTVPTAKAATFEKWKKVGTTAKYASGAEIPANQFAYDGSNQVCNLVATWKRNIRIYYDTLCGRQSNQ